MRRFATTLAGLVLAASSFGAGPAPERFTIADGTRVLFVEDHRVPLVHLVLEFPVGRWSPWMAERRAAAGLDMQWFDPRGVLRARADRLAVETNVRVERRASLFRMTFLRRDLEQVVSLVRDVLDNREFDPREIKRRRRQAMLAWKRARKEPAFRLRRAAVVARFAKGDPRRSELDEPERIETRPDRLVKLRDTIVRLPGRAIGLAGDLTRSEAERLASSLLPPVATETPEGLEPVLLAASARPTDRTERIPRLTQVYLALTGESPPMGSSDYPAFLVADHVLGGHIYSRLYVALRHEHGDTYGASTFDLGDVVPGAYALATFTRVSNAAQAEERLRRVLGQLRETGITEEERIAAVGYLDGRRRFDRQSPAQVLERALRERRLGLPPGTIERFVERARGLSLEEINRFVARHYDPARFTMVRVAPRGAAVGYDGGPEE